MASVLRRTSLAVVSGAATVFLGWPFVADALERRGATGADDVDLREITELPRAAWDSGRGPEPPPASDAEVPIVDPLLPSDPRAADPAASATELAGTAIGPGANPDFVETGPRLAPDWLAQLPPPEVVRERVFSPVDLEYARGLFPLGDGLSEYDPHCGYRYLPNLDLPRILEEHPLGRWNLRTNATGHRRDRDLAKERPDLRIVVTGDSHTDGVCNNGESFSGRLEALLAEADPGRTVEVLNAAKGGYTFFNYLGALRRNLRWRPHALVVTVYGGNDFMEALLLHAWFNGLPGPTGSKPYWPQVKEAIALRKVAMAQAILSLKYFAHRPEEIQVALHAAQQMLRYVKQVCEERDVRLIVAYLPPVNDVDPEFPWLALDRLREVLELSDDDLRSSDVLADLLLAWLDARGIETVDLRPAFRAADEPLYWARDLHINTTAHRLVARELAPLFAPGGRPAGTGAGEGQGAPR